MATQETRAARPRRSSRPRSSLLFLWMIVPLAMTLYFSLAALQSARSRAAKSFVGFDNYEYFLTDPAFFTRSSIRWCSSARVLVITVVGGTLLALLLDQPIFGRSIVRLHGDRALLRHADGERAGLEEHADAPGLRALRLDRASRSASQPIDWFAQVPLLSVIMIVAWQWLPFATLILLTALQSLDEEQKEAAEMDGAPPLSVLLLHRAAASGAADHRRDPDRDDLPAQRLRRDLRHRPAAGRAADHQPRLPRLSRRRCCNSTSAAPRPAASWRSCSPTSSPSSSSA